MASIYQFNTTVERIGHFRDLYYIVLESPLIYVRRGGDDLGFLTTLKFQGRIPSLTPSVATLRPITFKMFTIERRTHLVSVGKTVRRKVKNSPLTYETIDVYESGTARMTTTRWAQPQHHPEWSNEGSSTTSEPTAKGYVPLGIDFDQIKNLLRGVVDTNIGQPLIDYVVESSEQLRPFFTEPGWLPTTRKEFRAVKEAREKKLNAALEAMRKVAAEQADLDNRGR